METPNGGKNVEKLYHCYLAVENVKSRATLENTLSVSHKTKAVITIQLSNSTNGHLFQRDKNSC